MLLELLCYEGWDGGKENESGTVNGTKPPQCPTSSVTYSLFELKSHLGLLSQYPLFSAGKQPDKNVPFKRTSKKATVKIFLPHFGSLNVASLKVDLVNEHGANIKGLTIKDDTTTFHLPSAGAFKIRLSGKTHDSNAFQRMSSEEIRPQSAILRTLIPQSLLTIKRGERSFFRAAIDYAGTGSKTFTVKASVAPSNVLVSVRRSVTATNARPGYISVYLTAPARTPFGTIVKVHLLAHSGSIKLNLVAHLMVK